MPRKGQFTSLTVVEGIVHKRCTSCKRLLAAHENFYPRKGSPGGYVVPCKDCRRARWKGTMVFYRPTVHAWLTSVVDRVGKAEAARLIGVHKSQISKYYNDPPLRVHRNTAVAVLQVVRLLQQQDVALTKNSIRHGSVERGKGAVRPVNKRDFNGLRDPDGALYKRNQRRRERVDPEAE